MPRSTKIVATLGPASSDPVVLERMIRAGVDVVRLNFSHGSAADHEQRAALVKSIASKTGRTVAIMCDLQGPKIRVGRFKDGKITLEKGQRFVLDAACGTPFLIAKIDRAEAVSETALVDIMRGSDGIMVARGDLAVEVGDAAVPALQKKMIRLGREHNKLTITATQMMESMISSPVPTRAEVSDVANAVLDGTDAVMLSAETASGRYPVEVVQAMDRICIEAEQTQPLSLDQDFFNRVFTRVDQSIAMAALFTAYHLKVKAIASLTESGSTALWMSRLNAGVPIYALTSQTSTRYRCALFREVFPLMVKYVGHDREELLREAEKVLVENRVVKEGDLIVLTIGEPIGKAGGTNTMKIVRVGERRTP